MPTARASREDGARLSIGALARATGVPVETLRTWESRYGYPIPERKPSGHRVYLLSSVPRLRRIAQALAQGHRAGQVVTASDSDLSALLEATPRPAPPATRAQGDELGVPELLGLVGRFDADRLTRRLLVDWARLGPQAFLAERVVPLIRAVGDAWESGRFEIRHEHFLSERVGDLLRSLRLPFEESARGPLVVLGSLPGEPHALGLQMAALTLASAGCRILFLGTEVPPRQMADLARDLGALALAVSVSESSRGRASNAQLRKLREMLPRRVALLVGGLGAPPASKGAQIFHDLHELNLWGQRVCREAPAQAPLPPG